MMERQRQVKRLPNPEHESGPSHTPWWRLDPENDEWGVSARSLGFTEVTDFSQIADIFGINYANAWMQRRRQEARALKAEEEERKRNMWAQKEDIRPQCIDQQRVDQQQIDQQRIDQQPIDQQRIVHQRSARAGPMTVESTFRRRIERQRIGLQSGELKRTDPNFVDWEILYHYALCQQRITTRERIEKERIEKERINQERINRQSSNQQYFNHGDVYKNRGHADARRHIRSQPVPLPSSSSSSSPPSPPSLSPQLLSPVGRSVLSSKTHPSRVVKHVQPVQKATREVQARAAFLSLSASSTQTNLNHPDSRKPLPPPPSVSDSPPSPPVSDSPPSASRSQPVSAPAERPSPSQTRTKTRPPEKAASPDKVLK